MTANERDIEPAALAARIDALPGVERVRDAAARSGADAYLVGGSVRDALLGRDRADLDVAVEGDHLALARELGGELVIHERFATAAVRLDGGEIDVAAARAETYPRPGALPEVRPATIADDLARRDFTINAMGFPLRAGGELIDPHAGASDLRAGLLRVLHERSFVDDPTRALRAARYVARLGLDVEPTTLALLRRADLDAVSADRSEAELRKLAREHSPGTGFELLDRWGLVALPGDAPELIDTIAGLAAAAGWAEVGDREGAILAAARGDTARAAELARSAPPTPSTAVEAARGRSGAELLLARALGAAWLDRYVEDWRLVRLEISGNDLLAAGVDEGPAIGRGLAAALRAKLDGETAGRDDELRVALAAAAEASDRA
jgi:tRNA nucleotidyltransferase (CCA-adding enzyme)